MNSRNVLLTVLAAGGVRSWLGESRFLGRRLLLVSSHVEGARELCGVTFPRALIPSLRAPAS